MIAKIPEVIQSAELRRNLSKYLSQSETEPALVSAGDSDGTRGLINTELYNRLVQALEDHKDTKALEELVASDDGERIDWQEVKNKHCS